MLRLDALNRLNKCMSPMLMLSSPLCRSQFQLRCEISGDIGAIHIMRVFIVDGWMDGTGVCVIMDVCLSFSSSTLHYFILN